MKQLFLDFDGVFVHDGEVKLECAEAIRRVLNHYRPKVFLITFWQLFEDQSRIYQVLQQEFALRGQDVIRTPSPILDIPLYDGKEYWDVDIETRIAKKKSFAVNHHIKEWGLKVDEILILDDFNLNHPSQIICDPKFEWIQELKKRWPMVKLCPK